MGEGCLLTSSVEQYEGGGSESSSKELVSIEEGRRPTDIDKDCKR